ncbi:MAG: putative baseplate assembly protein [Anaerolineales bacterium]|nr:putative baseplate assembly protein [Anaerolineales bacterium]
MITQAPLIDKRTAEDIEKQVRDLLQKYGERWHEQHPEQAKWHLLETDTFSTALINIIARYTELIIQQLNRAPEKNLLAFLNLLGASLLPPQPARVPLTFFLAAGSAVDGVVPRGTPVAAPPAEGESEPVIFETERELVVTAAQLDRLFVHDPQQDAYADLRALATPGEAAGVALFQGNRQSEHIFYIGHSQLLAFSKLETLEVTATLKEPVESESWDMRWDYWNGSNWTEDGTETKQLTHHFTNLKNIPLSEVGGVQNRWLRCRLKTPIVPSPETSKESKNELSGMIRANQLPTVESITMKAIINRSALPIEQAFFNMISIDLNNVFFPFGEKPKQGDTLYLAQSEAFAQKGVQVTLNITLAQAGHGQETPELVWEFWNGTAWTHLKRTPDLFTSKETNTDENEAKPDEVITFLFSEKPESTTVNGVESYWIRARFDKGDYGQDMRYDYLKYDENGKPDPKEGVYVILPTFKPPVISGLTVDYNLQTDALPPEKILSYNDFVHELVEKPPFRPFRTVQAENARPTFYLGFTRPERREAFPKGPLTLFCHLADFNYDVTLSNGISRTPTGERLRLDWEYSTGRGWKKLPGVRDDTQNFIRSGLIEFPPPADFASRAAFGESRYWLRVRWQSGDYELDKPRLRQMMLNTTMAAQIVTLQEEILGSSDGSESKDFRTSRAPVLKDQQLEVRESEVWVPWQEVSDFYGSGPQDRHYVIDHLTGAILFGDGRSGLIPPLGRGNIRMARYRTGGGTAGNKPAKTIVQLKTTVPYVDKVTNQIAASGGAEPETPSTLLERAPRTIRHRERAVTWEDYEDLARLASPAVARAKCVPLGNLTKAPLDPKPAVDGTVSVIIVPSSDQPKPLPSQELLNRVRQYLQDHGPATAAVSVVGPLYLQIKVVAEIVPVSLEQVRTVERAIDEKLTHFLHPLTGGLDGNGWDFGRRPYRSDFYALLEAVPGVDYVRHLELKDDEDVAGVKETGRFLVYSGEHNVEIVFEEV